MLRWLLLEEDFLATVEKNEADATVVACRQSEDFKEGVAHFLEKRASRFTGQ